MLGIIYFMVSATLSLAVGVYAWVELGRMDASAVFLGLATAALAWVSWLLLRSARSLTSEPPSHESARATGRRKKELEREKQRLLKALKELEFDHEMGKVSDADYREIGGQYRARATRVLRQLDEASGSVDYRELVERDVVARIKSKRTSREAPEARAKPSVKTEPAVKPEGTSQDGAGPPSVKTDDARPRCAGCATENDADAEFCKRCGSRLRTAAGEVAKP